MESYIQDMFAERIGGSGFGKDTVIYKFEKIGSNLYRIYAKGRP